MTAAPDIGFDRGQEESATQFRSPGLDLFRLNPFRVFRLPASAVGPSAQWQAEKVITRRRAGVPESDGGALPWLPEADEIELGEAAQALEEPLRRLVEQIFWFELEVDPDATTMAGILAGDRRAITTFSALAEPPDEATPDDVLPTGLLSEAAFARMSGRINRANACLLLSWAALHQVGSRLDASTLPRARPAPTKLGALEVVRNPHLALVAPAYGEGMPAWLERALSRWAAALADAAFGPYVATLIVKLGDGMVNHDDIGTVCLAVHGRLVGSVVGEIKQSVLAGHIETAAALLAVAAQSAIEKRAWTQALRPLRYVFRADLDAIRPLLDAHGRASFDDVDLFLTRLGFLAKKWGSLDTSGLLGLLPTVDEGVSLAFERLRAIQSEAAPADRVAMIGDMKRLFAKAAGITTSESLRERLKTAGARLDTYLEGVCHFCSKREAGEHPVVLHGKKETGRTRHFNRTTIHYEIRKAVVPRCEECADLHQFVITLGRRVIVAFWLVAAVVALGVYTWPGWGTSIDLLTNKGVAVGPSEGTN